ncbi:hypothetical protein THRCLA_07032 [Thraustotheca clavata]|uniref:Uncharacterized protein n=1 Tax=Thraustotheca clavata TaxID=74557 RepID=A0A1V9ZH22_9STRA|nr:hypothetical protein THRCLA_07032 [Thraustotheca clavata]
MWTKVITKENDEETRKGFAMQDARWSTRATKVEDAKKKVKLKKVEIPNAAAATSQWKKLRQSVAVNYPVALERTQHEEPVRISHLCSEDKHKVGKLIRELIQVNGENDAKRCEIEELKAKYAQSEQIKQDLEHKLNQALEVIQNYQEKIQDTRKQNEREHFQFEQTLDALDRSHMEIATLKTKVAEQQEYITKQKTKYKEKHQRMQIEMEDMQKQLDIETKKRLEVQENLVFVNKRLQEEKLQNDNSINLSSVLNVSSNIPDSLRHIIDEWKARLETAIEKSELPEKIAHDLFKHSKSVVLDIGIQCDAPKLSEKGCNTSFTLQTMDTKVNPPKLSLYELVSALEEHGDHGNPQIQQMSNLKHERKKTKWANSYFSKREFPDDEVFLPNSQYYVQDKGPLSPAELSIREAVELDMKELLSETNGLYTI